MWSKWLIIVTAFVVAFAIDPARAGSGLLGLDHKVPYDDSGIWAREYQLMLIGTMIVGEIGIGVWEGGDTRLGKSAWQAIDATALSGLTVGVMKPTFGRLRPSETDNPNEWFQGGDSFPSGEVAVVTSIVTPFLLEYREDTPAVYSLAILPVYDAAARVKVHGHWQSDVLAGGTIGALSGYYARSSTSPFILSMLPNGVAVGLRTRW